jgi:hypothetical protein
MDVFTKLFGDFLVFVYHCFDRIVIHGYRSSRRVRRPGGKRAQPPLSPPRLPFEFGFRSEPEFIASTVWPARLVPQFIGPLADHLVAGARAVIPPSGRVARA